MTNFDNPFDTLADHALAEQRAGRTIPLDTVRREMEDQMTEPATDPGAGARDVLMAVCWNPGTVNTILAALAEKGYVIVARDDAQQATKAMYGLSRYVSARNGLIAALAESRAARPDGAR